MTQTQLIVLFVTFLLASLVVVPLVLIAFKKEKKKKEEEVQRIKRSIARDEARVRAIEAEAKLEALRKQHARLVEEFQQVKQQFRDLVHVLYPSKPCPSCASKVVKLIAFDAKIGVMTLSCGKCATERKTLPDNPKTFNNTVSQFSPAINAYLRVYDRVPDLPDLLFSI